MALSRPSSPPRATIPVKKRAFVFYRDGYVAFGGT
jgi:hypothetical protein